MNLVRPSTHVASYSSAPIGRMIPVPRTAGRSPSRPFRRFGLAALLVWGAWAVFAAAQAPADDPTAVPEPPPDQTQTPSENPNPKIGPVEFPPAPSGAEKVRLLPIPEFDKIRDESRIRSYDSSPEEHLAWRYVIAHARNQSLADLAAHSETVPFANLLADIHTDYLRQLIHVEGRLARVRSFAPTKFQKDADKIEVLYEGWIYPKDERWPLQILFTELPANIQKGEAVSYPVRFDGYFFKVVHFETGEPIKPGSEKHVWRKAPLLIGKAPVLIEPPSNISVIRGVAEYALLAIIVVGGGALALTLWYRRDDRRARAEVNAARTNPFDNPGPPQPPVSGGWDEV